MKLPPLLSRKSEKLALSFEYVNDRYHLLPSYMEIVRFFTKYFLVGILLFFLLFTARTWTVALWQVTTHTAQRTTAFVTNTWNTAEKIIIDWLPDPAPPVTIDTPVRNANISIAKIAQEQWQQAVANFPVHTLLSIRAIPEFIQNNSDLFQSTFTPQFNSMRQAQSSVAQEFVHVPFSAAATVRRISAQFSLEQPDIATRAAAELALLKQLENFNEINMQSFINQIDRAAAVEEFVIRGENLQQSARRTLGNISARRAQAQISDTTLQNLANIKEQQFFQNLNVLAIQQTEETFNEFVDTKQQTVTSRAEAGYLIAIEQRFANQLNILAQRLNAVQQNKAALIANVSVTPVQGVDLGLIR